MIEIKHLESLSAISKQGNLQEAANELSITQSALSHQIKDLESRLGLSLLNRRNRPAKLTEAAKLIIALADDVLPKIQRTENELFTLARGDNARFFVAIDCHSCFEWIMPTLDIFRQQWPKIILDLSAAFSFKPLPALTTGELDLVITADPEPIEDITFIPLFKYELVLAVAAENSLSRKKFIDAKDLQNEILITYPVERERLDIFTRFLQPAHIEPKQIRQTELTPMIIQLVNSNRGVAALPSWALHKQVEQNWIKVCHLGKPPGIWVVLYAAIRLEDQNKAYVRDFLTFTKQTCFSNLTGIRKSDTT